MKISLAIQQIDSILSAHFHFTDWEFGGGLDQTGGKAPRLEKTEWLSEQFKFKMNRLKGFLEGNPSFQQLEDFILQEVISIDPAVFFKEEYVLFIGKYNEIPYWTLKCKTANDYLQENRDQLTYEDSKI